MLFVLPRINPILMKEFTNWALFVGDLLYGLMLGAFYPIVRDTTAEPAPVPEVAAEPPAAS